MERNISATSVPLREEHKAATRQRILRALTDLLAEGHPATLSIPAVAARSGVSIPTIYRYFPTKEALLDGAARFGEELVLGGTEEAPELGTIDRWLRNTWTQMLPILPLVKSQHLSPVGRDVRRRRGHHRSEQLRTSLQNSGIDPGTVEGQRLEALIALLISSSTLLQLHETQGVPLDAAIAYTSWAIDQLRDASTRTEEPS
jgi:AcrR family transcriptional regulator